jgi:glycosyltransferase involved in cell wall biosynthesis
MPTAVVIPCLNEEATIAATCRSLGFGKDRSDAPEDTYLVLVDNNSTDQTWDVLHDIKGRSPKHSVVLSREVERGFVPARHRGIVATQDLAAELKVPLDEFVVLQADADTAYADGYAATMARAINSTQNVLAEGISTPPKSFLQRCPEYYAKAQEVDRSMHGIVVEDDLDVIVDDKVCGYRLSDYFEWGGHRREFNAHGEEILAETTRLFIRAKLAGAKRVRVFEAEAQSSRRKVIAEPLLHFATAGFPRESIWQSRWRQTHQGMEFLEIFQDELSENIVSQASRVRCEHVAVIFAMIPAAIALLEGKDDELTPIQRLLGATYLMRTDLTTKSVQQNAAILFESAFSVIDA